MSKKVERKIVSFALERYLIGMIDKEAQKRDRNRSEQFRRIIRGHFKKLPEEEFVKKFKGAISIEKDDNREGVSFPLDIDLYEKVVKEADKSDRKMSEQYRHIIWSHYHDCNVD